MSFDTLEEFTKWWLENKPFKAPFEGVSQPSNDISSVILYRDERFQVQLFIFQPHSKVTNHRHPNVNSYEHYLCGDVFFHKEGHEVLPREDFYALPDGTAAPLVNKEKSCITKVFKNRVHGATIGASGGSFFSIQEWLDGKPRLVEDDWIGEPMDEHHARNLSEKS